MIPSRQIEWKHADALVSTNATLSIGMVNASHHGEFICTAKNEYGSINIPVYLNILRKFQFSNAQQRNIKQKSENAVIFLICSGRGHCFYFAKYHLFGKRI